MELAEADRGGTATEALRERALEHEAAGRHEDAAATWGELAQALSGPDRAAALVRQAGILERALARPDEALSLYRRALQNDPHERGALAALIEHAAASDDWMHLALLETRRFEVTEDPGPRAEIALTLARIERRHLHNPTGARRWIQLAIEIDPEAATAHEALADLERESGNDGALLACLERVIQLRAERTEAALLLEAASLRSERDDPGRALDYLQRAATAAPEDALILDALAEVLERQGRFTDLTDVYERRAALALDDPPTRAAILAELGALYEARLYDPEAALEAYERAHAADPHAGKVEAPLARLRAKLDAPEAAAEAPSSAPASPDAALRAYEREARETTNRERLGVLVREIERLHVRRGTPDEALPWAQRWVVAAPEDPEALRALARLHDRPGHESELAAALEALDPLLPPAAQIANRRRIAGLHAARQHFDDAERTYAQALALDPGDLSALEGRAEALRALGRGDALTETLLEIAELQETDRRTATLREVARLQQQSNDLAGAIATLERLEAEDPSESVSEHLESLLARSRRFDELVEHLRARAGRYDEESAERVALELRCAQILLDPLERHAEAAETFRRVLEHAPESSEAKAGLERALRSSIDASGLADFLAEQVARAADPADRDRFAFERAVLLEELLDRSSEALEAFHHLADHSPIPEIRDAAARHTEQLLERAGEWSSLRDHLTQRLGQHSVDEDAKLHERLARLCADRLGDESGEIAHLEKVVELDPARADVWQILAERYERDGRVEDWARALEAELASGPDHLRELTLCGRLAELYLGALSDPDRTRAHYERVFELNPAHNAAAQYLIDVHEREGAFEEVVRLLEARLATIGDDATGGPHAKSRRTALRLQIAHVREARLGDLEGAISALEVALGEIGPEAVIAEPLAAVYQRAGYTLDLIELCRSAAAASPEPGERANWLVRLGDAHLAREQPREAASAYRRALTDRPEDRAVQASLRELYRELGDAEPLVELLEAELRHLAGTAEIPVRLELVERLNASRPADALLHARRVLELEPRHGPAYEAAVGLALRQGLEDEALAIVDRRLQSAAHAREAADLQQQRARLLAGPLGRPEQAIESYRDALRANPELREARAELAALLEQRERWPDLLALWEQEAREASPAERVAWIERGAEVAWNHVSVEAALPWLARLQRERPDDPEVWARLAQAHRRLGDDEALLRDLAAEADTAAEPDRARRCHLERAALLRDRGALARALAALEAAGPDLEVLRARESLQNRLGLHAERAKTLEALAALAGPDPALHREIAELYAGELREPAEAIRHWELALEQVPRGSAARIDILRSLGAVERRLGRIERWARYAEEELAALDPTPVFDDRRRELRCGLALAYDENLSRPDAALAHLRALLDAGDDELLGAEIRERLERTCLRLLRSEGSSGELERRLTRYLERGAGEAGDWLELAQLREEALRASAAAQVAYRRTLELDPDCLEALRGLRRTAQRLGRWQDVADALERETQHPSVSDPAERGALFRALGDLHWHRLQSTTRASRCYAAALEANGRDFAALRALERLLEAMEDWRGALDLYESEVAVIGDANPRRRREIWLRVAELARTRSEEPERARRALRHAAAIEPLESPHLHTLAELHEATGHREDFVETFARWCDAPDSEASGADQLRLAAALEAAGRSAKARERAEIAIACDPSCAAAWDAVARLRFAGDDVGGGAEALRRAAERVGNAEAAERLLEAATRLAPQNPEGALALLRTACSRDPGAVAAHAARARLAAELDRGEETEAAARSALACGSDPTISGAALVEVARLGGDAARRGEHLETAAGFYAQALRLAPSDAATQAAYGELLVELGDLAAARCVLEARLAHGDVYPRRARHRTLLGRCLEAEGELEEALGCFEDALSDDPRQPEALEASVGVFESLEQIEGGIAALERWARVAGDGTTRGERLLRAARWELRVGGREASAEKHLRAALSADPELAAAWIALVGLLLEQGRLEEAIEGADRAASQVSDPLAFGTLAHLQGRAFEQRGARRDAACAFGIAAECDPHCADAALAQARLLRGFGEWREAGRALADFAERYAGDDSSALAEVCEQLGRLRAGPLEDVDGAVRSYRRALELAPARIDARAALAELLSQRPGDWEEALAHHRQVLSARPTHTGSLRVALRIARGRADAALVEVGAEILRALGVASAWEREPNGAVAPLVTAEPVLADARFERLRLLARDASREIASALEVPDAAPAGTPTSEPEAEFRARVLQLQGELSAPALLARSSREVGEVLQLLVELVLDPEQVRGDGHLVNALSSALGRRRRRRLRRILGEARAVDFEALDFEAWYTEMRALAAAEAVRAHATPLRLALCALARESSDATDPDLGPEAHLVPLIERAPVASAFLRRIALDWLGRL